MLTVSPERSKQLCLENSVWLLIAISKTQTADILWKPLWVLSQTWKKIKKKCISEANVEMWSGSYVPKHCGGTYTSSLLKPNSTSASKYLHISKLLCFLHIYVLLRSLDKKSWILKTLLMGNFYSCHWIFTTDNPTNNCYENCVIWPVVFYYI